MMEKVLECRDLSYTYPSGKVVFKDINLVTHRNELVGIVGPTGTGKSTLVRSIAHLIPPTKGHVFLEGKEVSCPSPKISLIYKSDMINFALNRNVQDQSHAKTDDEG